MEKFLEVNENEMIGIDGGGVIAAYCAIQGMVIGFAGGYCVGGFILGGAGALIGCGVGALVGLEIEEMLNI